MDKGQGLPITTIVVAALGLLVLVILFAITTGRLGIFAAGASECPGVCVVTDAQLTQIQQSGVLEVRTPNACDEATEKQIGVARQYVARGVRKDNKPIACDRCCISTFG